VADAEQFVATRIDSSRRPLLFGEVIVHQLPAGDAAEMCAAREDDDQIVVNREGL